ncbi:MAG TPA: hypothetical protein VJS92_08610 [Candidatus Polarisedimenticolaceae bacterium]|nr:hypothetical protein [Candidatus Polarisedimenticolaceae bacterium]
MTLREAAQRTSRSITTLRRYIRSGRLHAEKQHGRFGPEYYVGEQELLQAGLQPREDAAGQALALTSAATVPALRGRALRDAVPLVLYQELQMKHEQLLVQYGMVRTGGLRVMQLQGELESRERELGELRNDGARARKHFADEAARLREELQRAQGELSARELEIAAYQEKVKALELLTRNAVTTEAIEQQFDAVMTQSRRVDQLTRQSDLQRAPFRVLDRDH